MATEQNEYRDVRLAKASTLRELGVNPYAVRTPKRSPIADLRHDYERTEAAHTDAESVPSLKDASTSGRVLSIRAMGKKAVFIDLWDESGKIQVYLNQKELSETEWKVYENLDLGDFIWVSGTVQRTRTGEISLFCAHMHFLTKAIAVPPLEKTGGLKDVETRLRHREMDLLASPEKRAVFATRSRIMSEARRFLDGSGFMEVETPMMHPILGGATARPFVTHHNALDMPLFLRIAPELYLKRLLVGGFERVYEINRNFRNEGIDHSHNPEFTMLELYEAYGDFHSIMELTESLIVHLARAVLGRAEGESLAVEWKGQAIDLTPPFARVSYPDAFREHVGCDMFDEAAVREIAGKHARKEDLLKMSHWKRVGELLEEEVEPKLINPTFLIDYPTAVCPLTKAREDKPELCERFELFINGMEFANAFSELNDPVEQQSRFEEQVKAAIATNDLESSKEVDWDYVQALELGMPPAGGLGVGIDRLVMLLTNQPSIRDILLFPHMRREQAQ